MKRTWVMKRESAESH